MSNRPKIKKPQMSKEAEQGFQGILGLIDKGLNQMSPGACMKVNPDEVGSFYVHTPNRVVALKSPMMLSALIACSTVIGEAAVEHIVQRANALVPLLNDITEPLPDEKRIGPDEFVNNLIGGQSAHLKLVLDKLNTLSETEGAAMGMMMSLTIQSILQPFGGHAVVTNDRGMAVLMNRQQYPLDSPTIFLYVWRYVRVQSPEDVVQALVLAKMIRNPFPFMDASQN